MAPNYSDTGSRLGRLNRTFFSFFAAALVRGAALAAPVEEPIKIERCRAVIIKHHLCCLPRDARRPSHATDRNAGRGGHVIERLRSGTAQRSLIADTLCSVPYNRLRWLGHPPQVQPRSARLDRDIDRSQARHIAASIATLDQRP